MILEEGERLTNRIGPFEFWLLCTLWSTGANSLLQSKGPIVMAGAAAKITTNLACLAVARNPHHSLGVLYSKTLRALAKMPNEYAYRKQTEQVGRFWNIIIQE